MSRQFHDVRNMKKTLAYGNMHGLGPFRQRAKKTAPVLEHRDGTKGNKLTMACYPPSLPKNEEEVKYER